MVPKDVHIRLFPVLLVMLFVFSTGQPLAQELPDQEEPSEEMLKAPEDKMEILSGQETQEDAAQEEAPVREREMAVEEPDAGAEGGVEDDAAGEDEDYDSSEALPDISADISRIRIESEGFGLAAGRNVTIHPGENSGDPLQGESAEEIRQEAFDAALTGLFPLRPEDIEILLKHYDRTEQAAQSPPYALPRPEVSVQTISMDPGVTPPFIKTAVGHVTTVNMLDITGAPWPVEDITWAGDFEIIEPEEGGHIIRITPMAKFGYGNMSVRLLTLKTPITFALRVGRDAVHYRVDARIPEFGPFAQAQLMEGGTQLVAGNSTLTTVLDGVPPPGAVRLSVSGVDGRTSAYKVGGLTYVRTPMTLLSPGWESSVSCADGMSVYALSDTPVLLLSDQGRFVRAKLKEQEDLFDE